MRLNVFLQRTGAGSRREAERMVAEGRVTVNGRIAEATMPVEEGDQVTLDGHTLTIETRTQPRLYMLNKPLDVLVTNNDAQGRMTVFDLDAMRDPTLPRLMYVGRLDVNSEGLLLFSDDGALAQILMSPATGLPRVYRVRVHGRLSPGQLERLARGITIEGTHYRGAKVEEENTESLAANAWYRVTIYEGKNREVRKLMEHMGCVVNRLIRVAYGPFELGKLEVGALRQIPDAMVANLLRMLIADESAS
jgi:23S rRNA pseudouridine2605 synthase